MTIEQPRQPKGVPTGGQFAGATRTEATVQLAPAGPGRDPVRDVDEVLLAAQDEVQVAWRAANEVGDQMARVESEERAARRAMDDWNAKQWGKPAERAPQELRDELQRVERAKVALRAERETARQKVAAARARVTDLADHYPWAGTGTPVIRFTTGLQRPVDVAPSGRFGFYEFPQDDPRHGAVGIASPAGDQWGPFESVTPERLATLTSADGSASFAPQDYVNYRIQMTAEDVQALKRYAARRDTQLGAAA